MLGYSILDKSMNGIKTVTDGISIISDGIAQHENIIYNDYIKSQDGLTEITNDKVITEEIDANIINAGTITSSNESTNTLSCNYLYVNDISNPLADVMEVNGQTKKLIMYSPSEFRDTVNVINKNLVQTQAGFISQTGTNFNTLKDTKINGFLEVGSNITQTGGSTTLKDVTCDNITQNTGKGITQSGTATSNTFGTSTVTNLTITGSVSFPSNVTIPGTTTSDDIVMNGSSVITQDITVSTTKFNKFRYTKTLDLDVDGNFSQIKAGATATLKNTTIQGTSILQGDIEQTAGATKLNTIECNNITLRTDNSLNISGTGKINQTGGTSENTMNAIALNNNQNITFNGTGIISQPLNGTNILSHFRSAGFAIIGGRNNTTYTHYQNIQNNNGLQFQYNRDNSSFYSYLLNNRVGSGGGFRFQRYNGGVYVDEPLVIDDNITFNKDVSIVGKSITASSATLGIISQNELDCLDNCNTNIITKFNNLDSQIANLQTTTGGVTTATTGISYNSGSDTTTIDNNLIVSTGKSLTLGSTNVNGFITDTNTFITATSNTLQGIVYTSGDDTTTINNNVNVTGNFLVQGMNVKAEIDALETSFTTGTLNTTNLTAGTLNVSNLINMTNPIRASRIINNIGFLQFCNYSLTNDNNIFQVGQSGTNTYFNNYINDGQFQFLGRNQNGTNNTKRCIISPDSYDNKYNTTTNNNDVVIAGVGAGINDTTLNLTCNSTTATGVRIEPTKTTLSAGNNNIYIDSSTGLNVNGVSNFSNSINNDSCFITRQNNMSNVVLITKTGVNIANGNNSSGSGTVTQTILNFTVTPYYNKQITLNLPISVYRLFKNSSTAGLSGNNFTDKINNITYTIYKNNVVWQNGNCNSSETLAREVILSCTAKTSDMSYEFFMTNASISFIPSSENVAVDYRIDYIVNYSYTITSTNFVGLNYTYVFNTDVTTVSLGNVNVITDPLTGQLVIGPYGTTYQNGSYTITKDTTNYYNGSGEIWTNDVISNEIRTSTLNTNSLFCSGFLKGFSGIAGYMVNGSSSYNLVPLFCSLKQINPNDSDNYFIVMPGYRFVLYRNANYDDSIKSIDNTNGTSPIISASTERATSSIKIFFNNSEVTLTFLS